MKLRSLTVLLALALVMPLSVMAEKSAIPDLRESHLKIPWSDFKKILEKLQEVEPELEPQVEEEPKPPVPFVITSADYKGEMKDGAAGFDFVIKFTVLEKEEWLVVPVLPPDLAIQDLKLDQGPALVMTVDGWHRIALHSPGAHTLTGRFFVKPQNRRGPRSVTFPIPRTPVTNLSFTVPEPGLSIEADPANLNRMIDEEKVSRLVAVLPPTDRVTLSWSKKIETEEAELRMNADVESLVSLGERLCRVETRVRYEILHRGVTKFQLRLPQDAAVVDVTGQGMANWKVKKKGDKQIVTVSLNYEAKDSYYLNLTYETGLPDATAEALVPQLEVLGVSREVGHLGVAARTNIELEVNSLKNLGSVDVSKLPGGIINRSSAPLIFAFKYIGHPWELKLQATKHQEVEILTCTVDHAALHSFLTKDGELITRAVYTIRNNREQFIRIKLPDGARVFNTFRGAVPVQPASDKEGRILIPLEKSTGGSGQAKSFTIEITYLIEKSKLSKYRGTLNFKTPETDIMTNEMEWVMYLPREYKYKVKIKETDMEVRQGKSQSFLNALGKSLSSLESRAKNNLAMKDQRVPMSQVAMNVQFNQKLDQGAFVRGSLPVRFAVPQTGSMLSFHKTIVQEKESNSITLTYKKILKLPRGAKHGGHLVIVVLVVSVLIWLLVRHRRKRKYEQQGTGQ